MRTTKTFCAVIFAAAALLAAPVLGQDRYGGSGSSSSLDLSKAFDSLPSSSQAGGYRSSEPTTGSASGDRSAQPLRTLDTPPRPQTPSRQSTTPPSPGRLRSLDPPAASSRSSASTPSTTTPSRTRSSDPFAGGSGRNTSGSGTRSQASPRSDTTARTTAGTTSSRRDYTQPSTARDRSPSRFSSQANTTSGSGYQSGLRSERSRLQDSSFGSDLATQQAGVRERRTRKMLEKMLRRHPDSRLTGNPMSLSSVVASAGSREEQAQRVESYWALTSAAADYYLGLVEADELTRLKQQVSTYSKPLNEWQTNLATRIDTSLKAARAAQFRLGRQMGGGVMPLPTDTPFTGPYATRYQEIFPAGAPGEARLLNELLPLRLSELEDAAEAVARSEKWLPEVAKDQGRGSDGKGVIMAMELLALNRRAFVQLARDYNLQINRYTQLTAPERVDTGRLVAMLIRTPQSTLSGDGSLFAGGAGGGNSANLDFRPGGATRR